MKVVFDSNIYISALVIPGSSAERAIERILAGHDILLLSKPILDEVLATLARKFSRDAEAVSRVAILLTEMAQMVQPEKHVDLLEDEPDNRLLECADTGEADLLVTGDKAVLRLKRHHHTRIVSLREYLEL